MRFCLKGQCNFCHEKVIILIKIPYVEDGNIFRKYLQFEEKSFVGRQNIMLCQEKIHVWKWESPCCSPQFILMSRENSSLSENILVLALSLHYLNITQLPQILHQSFSLPSWRRPRTSWSACGLYRSWRVGSKSLIVSLGEGCPEPDSGAWPGGVRREGMPAGDRLWARGAPEALLWNHSGSVVNP